MKILHYLPGLPPARGGGLVKYALDLAEGELRLKNEVSILAPGKLTLLHPSKVKIVRKHWNNMPCYHVINPLPVSGGKGIANIEWLYQRGDIRIYLKFLGEMKPTVIHVHSFMGLHISFLEAAHQLRIPVIYTTHDYFGLCPKVTLMKGEKECCEKDWSKCSLCIEASMSQYMIYWEQSDIFRYLKNMRFVQWVEYSKRLLPIKLFFKNLLGRYKKSRKYKNKECEDIVYADSQKYDKLRLYYKEMFGYITGFHFNSRQTQKVYCDHLGVIKGKIVHISNKGISDNRIVHKYGKTLHIGYIASNEYFKGFPILKAALDALYTEGLKDFICHVYTNPKEMNIPYLRSHKPYKAGEIGQVLKDIDILVLPSVWKETFGMVVLEALSYGVPVLISQNVGAKDILEKQPGMGIVVDAGEEALKNTIRQIYNNRDILKEMNKKICDWKVNLSFEKHVNDMIKLYNSMQMVNEEDSKGDSVV